MRALALVLAVLAGCRAESDPFPGGPGGSGGGGGAGGGGGGADGGSGGDGGTGAVTIRLCRLTDLRGVCSQWDGTSLDVREDGGSPTTVAGDFTVARPSEGFVQLTLDDPGGIYFGAALRVHAITPDTTVGLMQNADLDEVFIASGITPVPGTGVTVMAFDDPGGAPAPGFVLGGARGSDPWYATDVEDVFVLDGATTASGVAGYFDIDDGDFSTDGEYLGSPYLVTGYGVPDALVLLHIQL